MGLHIPRLSGSVFVIVGMLLAGLVACSSSSDATDDGATPNPNGAIAGAACKVGFDCRSGICNNNLCAASPDAANSSPTDGMKNGDETDVDCGGSRAPKCADGKGCAVGGDCKDAVCTGGMCAAPSPTDGLKNGDETDVDCGGAKAPKCATGKACAAHADCASDGCSYEKKCVDAKGCTAHFGGDTCGAGETGAPDAKHESCCTRVNIPDGPNGAFTMDKYLVTAGRMRAFAERYQGNLKQWAMSSPKGWDDSLSPMLPENMDDINLLLGPNGKRGCNIAAQGARTFSQPAINGDATEKSDFSQDVLDEKGLNCVPWYMAAAVCAFDGGQLVSAAEMKWVYENHGNPGGATTYPWQFKDTSPYNPMTSDMRLVHRDSYQTANPPAGMRTVNGQYPLDHAFWIAPPGRRPTGANMNGVMDAAGNLMPWVRDGQQMFIWTQSWENHEKNMTATSWTQMFSDTPDGYYALGVRCTY